VKSIKTETVTEKEAKKVEGVRGPFCAFCKEGKDPTYKDYEALQKYLNDRGRILPRSRTGNCSKHQRRMARAIKHARHLGLLPFLVKPE
jgi:small subunit ribosomal protein S18